MTARSPSPARILAVRDRVCEELALSIRGEFPEGSTGWVGPVSAGDGASLVLKVAWAHEESRDEALGLRLWAQAPTRRVPAVLEARREDDISVILMERVGPGTTLAASGLSPEQEDEVAAALLRDLWLPAAALPGAPDHGLRPLAHMCGWWADEAAARLACDAEGLPSALVARGLDLMRSLPREPVVPDVLLITDFHHHNVLASRKAPTADAGHWRMIDPKPYVGDPHYDLLQHMLNDERRLRSDPLGLAGRMARLTGLDPERTARWLLARCVQEARSMPGAAETALRLADEGV